MRWKLHLPLLWLPLASAPVLAQDTPTADAGLAQPAMAKLSGSEVAGQRRELGRIVIMDIDGQPTKASWKAPKEPFQVSSGKHQVTAAIERWQVTFHADLKAGVAYEVLAEFSQKKTMMTVATVCEMWVVEAVSRQPVSEKSKCEIKVAPSTIYIYLPRV